MFLKSQKHTGSLAIAILLFYTAPIAAWTLYSFKFFGRNTSWTLFSSGLVLLFFGSLFLLVCLKKRDRLLATNTLAFIPEENQESFKPITEELESLTREDVPDRDELVSTCHELQEKLSLITLESSETIEELKNSLDHKQQQISHLENQIHDLRYEIKTLLNLTEIDYRQKSPSLLYQEQPLLPLPNEPVRDFTITSLNEAKALLKQCLFVAQRITGSNQFKSSSKLGLLPLEHTTLDLRVLFDAFREETSALIAVFSTKDHKLIFANNQAKPLFGYHPDKFVQDFLFLIKDCRQDWEDAIQQLITKSETSMHLAIRSRSGETLSVACCLSTIPTGIFRDLGICVLFLD